MVNNNGIPLEVNKKPLETVYEIKNEVPSFEEFMKNYESDDNLNYDDLSGGDIGEAKGYGPCHSCGNRNLKFKLIILLKTIAGGEICGTVCSTDHAEQVAREIRNATGFWEDSILRGIYSKNSRELLANKIITRVDKHKNGGSIDETVTSDYEGGGSDCSLM